MINLNQQQADSLANDITYIFKYYFQYRYVRTKVDAGSDIQRRYYECRHYWNSGQSFASARQWIATEPFLSWFSCHAEHSGEYYIETEKT